MLDETFNDFYTKCFLTELPTKTKNLIKINET